MKSELKIRPRQNCHFLLRSALPPKLWTAAWTTYVPTNLRPEFPPILGIVLGFKSGLCGLFFHSHLHCEFAWSDIAQRRVGSVAVFRPVQRQDLARPMRSAVDNWSNFDDPIRVEFPK